MYKYLLQDHYLESQSYLCRTRPMEIPWRLGPPLWLFCLWGLPSGVSNIRTNMRTMGESKHRKYHIDDLVKHQKSGFNMIYMI